MRLFPLALPVAVLTACSTGPSGPAVWTANDMNDALLRNLASVSDAMAGEWVPAGASCSGLVLDMDLSDARPELVPDIASWFTALSGATLALAPVQPAAGEQAYVLTTPLGEQRVVRDLATNGVIWQMPDRGELRVFPSYVRLDGGALDLLIDADTVSVRIGSGPPIAFSRCS